MAAPTTGPLNVSPSKSGVKPGGKPSWIGDGKTPVVKPGTPVDPGFGSHTPSGNFEDYLQGDQKDAFLALNSLFKSYGLESLAPKIYQYIQQGYSGDTISILLQDTPEYKQRFAANEDRKKKGLPVLSPAEYIQTEDSYRQLIRQAGLPESFYDQPSDFQNFISKDVSPTELQSRVELASQATALANPAYKDSLQRLYGIGDSELNAYFLDPDRALPILQKTAAAAAIGAEAQQRGIVESREQLEKYASAGISQQQAASAFGQVAQYGQGFESVAKSFGENLSQRELEEAFLLPGVQSQPGQESAAAHVQRLQSWQRARSQGQAGGAQAGLARR